MAGSIEIRRLLAADSSAYREIRLEALRTRPDAFGGAYEDERRQAPESFADSLSRDAVFGAWRDAALLGIAGFARLQGKESHKGLLWGMYVRDAARGSGAADALVGAAIGHARTEVESVLLAVGTHNEPAQRLYRRHGFVEYGREPRALKVRDVYYDETMMRLELLA
ncbi:MAG: N-acetyltransferase family protein [Reyranellaceae bacterium]